MAAIVGECRLLELPFEVRQAIYEQLLANLTIHACPDESQLHHGHASTSDRFRAASLPNDHRSGRSPGNFYDDLMECSGHHYQSLITPGKWSNVCSPRSDYKASDVLHLMLACKKIYYEIEPLFWSTVTLAISLPSFGTFFESHLSISLWSRAPARVPRGQVLSKLVLSLPRTLELASKMGHDPRYRYLSSYGHIAEKVKQSLDLLAESCRSVRSIQIIMDAEQLDLAGDADQIMAYSKHDVVPILRMQGLEEFKVAYSGEFPSSYFDEHAPSTTVLCDRHLEVCERALWEMATGKGEPLDPEQDRTGWLGDFSVAEDEDPRLKEFCERAIRHYNT